MSIDEFVYIGFNRRIAALDRQTGQLVWEWKSPQGSGYVALLLDGSDLFVSVNGYTYCLDARTGDERWRNSLSGFGLGVPCIATSRGQTPSYLGYAADQASRRESTSHSTHAHG